MITVENLNLRGAYKKRVLIFIRAYYTELSKLYDEIFIKKDNSYWEKLKKEIEEYTKLNNISNNLYYYDKNYVDQQAKRIDVIKNR